MDSVFMGVFKTVEEDKALVRAYGEEYIIFSC
jgi:hypothetical protein